MSLDMKKHQLKFKFFNGAYDFCTVMFFSRMSSRAQKIFAMALNNNSHEPKESIRKSHEQQDIIQEALLHDFLFENDSFGLQDNLEPVQSREVSMTEDYIMDNSNSNNDYYSVELFPEANAPITPIDNNHNNEMIITSANDSNNLCFDNNTILGLTKSLEVNITTPTENAVLKKSNCFVLKIAHKECNEKILSNLKLVDYSETESEKESSISGNLRSDSEKAMISDSCSTSVSSNEGNSVRRKKRKKKESDVQINKRLRLLGKSYLNYKKTLR